MCFHNKPTRNDSTEGRAPAVLPGDTILFDEPGRCSPQVNGTGSTDCHSYHFRMVGDRNGGFRLLVRHGCGDEAISFYDHTRLADILAAMDSDSRFLTMVALFNQRRDGDRAGMQRTESYWTKAAAEKRIKVRKTKNGVSVCVVPA